MLVLNVLYYIKLLQLQRLFFLTCLFCVVFYLGVNFRVNILPCRRVNKYG